MAQSEHHQARRHPHREPADGAAAPAANGATDGRVDGGGAGTAEIKELQSQLSEERNRAEGYLAQWQRAAADFQNFKRRTEQEREETARLANLALVFNVLPAVDDLDRALDNVDASIEGSSWVEGIRQIQRKLKGALEASGVREIRAEGEEFDPNIHEAISQTPGEHNRVVAEVRRGYKLGNRVIRPAMVVVGNGEQSGAT